MVRRMGIPKREYHGTGSGGVRRFRRCWWTDAYGRTTHTDTISKLIPAHDRYIRYISTRHHSESNRLDLFRRRHYDTTRPTECGPPYTPQPLFGSDPRQPARREA